MNTKLLFISISLLVLIILTISPIILNAAKNKKHNYKPKNGYVQDSNTAIAIAVAVWITIYGKDTIENEKPYNALLKDGIWFVTGSLPAVVPGGVAEAEIAKKDGRILRISHGA